MVRYHPSHENWHETAQNREAWQKTLGTFEKAVLGKNHPHNLEENPHPEASRKGKKLTRPSGTTATPQQGPDMGASRKRKGGNNRETLDNTPNPYPTKKARLNAGRGRNVLEKSLRQMDLEDLLEKPLITLAQIPMQRPIPQDGHDSEIPHGFGERQRLHSHSRAGQEKQKGSESQPTSSSITQDIGRRAGDRGRPRVHATSVTAACFGNGGRAAPHACTRHLEHISTLPGPRQRRTTCTRHLELRRAKRCL